MEEEEEVDEEEEEMHNFGEGAEECVKGTDADGQGNWQP